MESGSIVLCDDKPGSFGAPDVLQLSAEALRASHCSAWRLPGHPPDLQSVLSMQVR